MDKSHDMDDIALLTHRFHALMDKVQGLLDELHGEPLPGEGGDAAEPPPGGGQKAFTILPSGPPDERRQKALIRVIDDALKQIDHAVSGGAGPESDPEAQNRVSYRRDKKVFTLEELSFLEKSLRSALTPRAGDTRSDGSR